MKRKMEMPEPYQNAWRMASTHRTYGRIGQGYQGGYGVISNKVL
jgi:hypothetical protein